ncbi:unnamed protein product [Microthlaspi erraticum]|uniref:Jacalin-type lectin domain-containing protein n=1 Tax=Microthlaspi erraticum TaxID=1685480 RepID=A0A6D2J882_9BRAS|nr:unnamed protein product [Microthlaspi erraticum]
MNIHSVWICPKRSSGHVEKIYGRKADENDSTRIVRLNHETEFVTGISGEKSYSGLSSLRFIQTRESTWPFTRK